MNPSDALRDRRARAIDDPLFPIAVLRGDALLGSDPDPRDLLASWTPGVTRETGAVRYRWAMNPRFIAPWPAWIGPQTSRVPWRARDAAAWAERPQRSIEDIERLLTPLILADSLQLLVDAGERADECGDLARDFLDEALPKARRDAARWVLESRAWADTWALWAIARRPGALTLLYPFALAIGDSYATSARRAGNLVRRNSHSTASRSSRAALTWRPASSLLGFNRILLGPSPLGSTVSSTRTVAGATARGHPTP